MYQLRKKTPFVWVTSLGVEPAERIASPLSWGIMGLVVGLIVGFLAVI